MKMLGLKLILIGITAVTASYYDVPYCDKSGECRFLVNESGKRVCSCMSGTQTDQISYDISGSLRLFSTTDCTGAYETVTSGTVHNAEWVNSISFGPSGTSYMDGDGCGNRFF